MDKILIIEDDIKIARFVELELTHEGYSVEIAHDGREGLGMAQAIKYQAILLDLMLPKLSGIEVCRRIRQEDESIPILMLTAKDDVTDKVTGLDIGADDYITKPFAIEELLARIRVVLKRSSRMSKVVSGVTKIGHLTINPDAHVVSVEDVEIELTAREYDLLLYLVANKNCAVSREKILNDVWGFDYLGETNVVDVYISYLRSKIDQPYGEKLIRTVRSVGYIIKEDGVEK
ncbi:MAG: response regulator transcription factor [Clostridiales bacterium]|nr:response regulator transcription factor [Clostridiales bacterium]